MALKGNSFAFSNIKTFLGRCLVCVCLCGGEKMMFEFVLPEEKCRYRDQAAVQIGAEGYQGEVKNIAKSVDEEI